MYPLPHHVDLTLRGSNSHCSARYVILNYFELLTLTTLAPFFIYLTFDPSRAVFLVIPGVAQGVVEQKMAALNRRRQFCYLFFAKEAEKCQKAAKESVVRRIFQSRPTRGKYHSLILEMRLGDHESFNL